MTAVEFWFIQNQGTWILQDLNFWKIYKNNNESKFYTAYTFISTYF